METIIKTDIKLIKPILNKLTKNTSRPILSHVKANGNDIQVTDLETYVTIKNYPLKPGLYNPSHLGLCETPSTDVDVDEYPLFSDVNEENSFNLTKNDLKFLLQSTSTDKTRRPLNPIAWVDNDIVATDGYTLCKRQVENINSYNSSILPRSSLSILVTLLNKYKVKETQVIVGESFFTVDNEHFTLSGRLINSEYVKYSTVIPNDTKYFIEFTDRPKYKDLKSILNTKNYSIELSCDSGVVTLKVPSTDFTKVVGETNFTGSIGFNMKYLDVLTSIEGVIKFNNEVAPFKVDNLDRLTVAMPLKL